MKIAYFSASKGEAATVLMYGNDPRSVATLAQATLDLAEGVRERFAVHELAGFESSDGTELFFSVGASDLGVQRVGPHKKFDCIARPSSWRTMAGLLEPFCESMGPNSFQYLDDFGNFSSDIQLMISTKGFFGQEGEES